MSQPLHNREKLQQLVERGSLPRSICSEALLELVTPLISAGVLAWQRSGAGKRLTVVQPETLVHFCKQHFPHSADEASFASARVAGVAQFRDSKILGSTEGEIVTLRGWENGGLTSAGAPVDIVTPTLVHGVFSFVLKPETPYAIRMQVALVENPAVFLEFERLRSNLPVAIYAHGRISDRLLDWLASQRDDGFQLIHFGDYDPVGLDEFRRLASKLGERAKLYIPTNLAELFRKYSKRDLLVGAMSQKLLAGLRESGDTAVQRVIELIERHNGGLEQEALLIDAAE